MLFQTLDSKQECVGVYKDGTLLFGESKILNELEGSRTWSYASYLEGRDIEYANLYCGLPLNDVCPEHLRSDWEFVNKKLEAYMRSILEAKISLDDVCFYDMVPERFLADYCYMKDKICDHVFENYPKPENYDHLLATAKLAHKIGHQKIRLNWSNMRSQMHKKAVRDKIKRLKQVSPYCKYNIFGTKTGRLTTKRNSFPILTLSKDMRKAIQPANDCFISFDFNGAELRTLLALGGSEQPSGDIHEWNRVNVFRNLGTREEAKKRLFSWLYNPESNDYLLERFYDRDSLVKKWWDGTHVRTPYGRNIEVDKRRALNYLIQSTTSDVVLEQASKVDELLAGKNTRIAFIIHDEVVLDVDRQEAGILAGLKDTFSNTRFGAYLVGAKEGADYGIAA
jgi:hypothetical protein